jgi:CRP/FNR family transcriptional regulator
MARILEVLARHPLFEGTPREDLADLVIDCRYRTPAKGERFFEAGDPSEAFFVVVGGEVKLSSATPAGRECVVEVVRAGESFALVSVLDGDPHPVSATALTDCGVIRVPRAAFLRLLARRPALGARTMQEVARRVNRFRSRLEEIGTRTVPARVAGHILRQAELQAGSSERGAILDLGATREVVAAAVGTVREVFVRTIRGFERQGLVSIDGRRVEIRDPARLRDVAADRGRRAAPGGLRIRAALREGSFAAAPRAEVPGHA